MSAGMIEALVSRIEALEALVAELGRPTPQLVTVADYAKQKTLGITTVRQLIRDGRLPAVRVGRAVRVRSDAEIGRPVQGAADAPAARSDRILGLVQGGRP